MIENIDNSKPVTKGLLQAFGAKCKQMFKANPTSFSGNESWLKIKTTIPYQSVDTYIGLNVKSILFDISLGSYLAVVNAEIYAELNNYVDFAEGYNQGKEKIGFTLFYDEDTFLTIVLEIKNAGEQYWVFNRGTADLFVIAQDGTVLETPIDSIEVISAPESLPDSYTFIGESSLFEDLDDDFKVGDIQMSAVSETVFDVVTDKDDLEQVTESVPYSQGVEFDTIYKSKLTHKLDRTINILYDWSHQATSENPIAYEGSLDEETDIVLKVPQVELPGGTSGTFNRVVVDDGVVVEGSDDPIPVERATGTEYGGIKLASESTATVGEPIYVKLDELGRAFIDKETDTDLLYRVDLNNEVYSGHPEDFKDMILLHVGSTTDNFVNGYFYKSQRASFLVQQIPNEGEELTYSNYPYSSFSTLGSSLYDYIYANKVPISVNYGEDQFTLSVTQESWEEGSTVSDFIYTFGNKGGEPLISVSATDLYNIFGVKLDADWDKSTHTIADITYSFLFVPSNNYIWKLWEVQPGLQLPPILRYMGEVLTYSQLDLISNPRSGDVWAVIETGGEYFYKEEVESGESHWQLLGKEIPAQVLADWNQTDNTAVDFIKNKPTIPAAQIQSDWNQSNTAAVDYVKNKPTIPTVYNNKLTLLAGGTTAAEFTANSNTDLTLNIKGSDNASVSKTADGEMTVSAKGYAYDETRNSITIGHNTHAVGYSSNASGIGTTAVGSRSHAEGFGAYGATGGYRTVGPTISSTETTNKYLVSNMGQMLLTDVNKIILFNPNTYSGALLTAIVDENQDRFITTNNSLGDNLSNAETEILWGVSYGWQSHSEGEITRAIGDSSHAEGEGTLAIGEAAHAEGINTTASGLGSHAGGYNNALYGGSTNIVAAGDGSFAHGCISYVAGATIKANGNGSFAGGHCSTNGDSIIANGIGSFSYGIDTKAYGAGSHAEGKHTGAYGENAHSEGSGYEYSLGLASWAAESSTITLTNGNTGLQKGHIIRWINLGLNVYRVITLVIDSYTIEINSPFSSEAVSSASLSRIDGVAYGDSSHAEGANTIAIGEAAHTEGRSTIALKPCQSVIGTYNIPDNSEYLFIVGNGTSASSRSNAFAIDKDGNLVLFNNGTPVVLTPAKLAQLVS